MISTFCLWTIDPNSTPPSLRCYFSASNVTIVNKTSTKMLDKFTAPRSVITKDTKHFFDMLPLECEWYKYIQPGQVSPNNADVVWVFLFLLHNYFVDNQLEFHEPFYSKSLSGMMQAIQIYNNQHGDEELFPGPQCLKALMVQLEYRRRQLATQPRLFNLSVVTTITVNRSFDWNHSIGSPSKFNDLTTFTEIPIVFYLDLDWMPKTLPRLWSIAWCGMWFALQL